MYNFLDRFMKEYFDGLVIRPPLFYLSKYGIRFEIANPYLSFEADTNLKQIQDRSRNLFNHIFDESDELLLVTNVYCEKNGNILGRKPLNIYKKYIRNKGLLGKLQYRDLPNLFLGDDEEETAMITKQFVLPCKKSDIKYTQLLKAISYEDFKHPMQILKGFPQYGYDIFFVNLSKKIIFHLYDDRGCDVIASNKEEIRCLYEFYNDWILEYDRHRIDSIFLDR